ncbi:Formin-like protein 14 [Camellia lanceoleosa]|uniref:Formin-like protein 14 n=1 Tax=Camellia lanceoleosa TaxID=1840588 RepID=A0ACC0GEV9_9ERIC|nr:Formin-like protein 14 [Camellia lanceoleosa]
MLYFQNAVLALDSSALDIDLVENLIKFCPAKEEMTMLKLIAEKMPELLDFDKDLVHLEAASKIQLKSLAEEMQAVSKGLEKVEQEVTASENDGAISAGFQKGRSADSLSPYFGDPARCPFEQG